MKKRVGFPFQGLTLVSILVVYAAREFRASELRPGPDDAAGCYLAQRVSGLCAVEFSNLREQELSEDTGSAAQGDITGGPFIFPL